VARSLHQEAQTLGLATRGKEKIKFSLMGLRRPPAGIVIGLIYKPLATP